MLLCANRPHVVKHFRSSRGFLSSAPSVMLMSYEIDPELRKVHEHMITHVRQSDFYAYFMRFLRRILLAYIPTLSVL